MAKNNNGGFTLIEIVIVITIIGVLSVMGISSYTTFHQSKELELETYKFVEAFELGKNQAITGEKICPEFSGTYSLSWSTSGYLLTPNGCSRLFSYDFPPVVLASSSGSVIFKPLGAGIESSNCIILSHRISKKCRKVTLNAAGTINEQKEADCSCP